MKGWTPQAAERAAGLQKQPQERAKPLQQTTACAPPIEGLKTQEITFPGKVPGNNGAGGLLRMHWATKKKLLANYMLAVKGRPGFARYSGPVRIELVRYSIGPEMDYDNLVSTGKLILDAIVRCGILPDDNPTVIAERSYTQERAASKAEQRTVIRLIQL